MRARKRYVAELLFPDYSLPKAEYYAAKVAGPRRRFELAPREVTGQGPCPGEAHLPEVAGRIDNCGICAPLWGWVDTYAPPTVAQCRHFAVPCSWIPFDDKDTRRAFEAAEREGRIRQLHVEEVRPWGVSSFFAWVAAPRPA